MIRAADQLITSLKHTSTADTFVLPTVDVLEQLFQSSTSQILDLRRIQGPVSLIKPSVQNSNVTKHFRPEM